jgi:hypothetical protein
MGPIQKCVEVDIVDVACAGWDSYRSYCDGFFLSIYCDC